MQPRRRPHRPSLWLQILVFLAALVPARAYRHPGVVVSREQMEFVKQKIAAGEEPWKSAFAKLKSSAQGSLSWQPKPRATVDCGPYSNPNNGCSEERDDAVAAYAHALQWYFTGNRANAQKAVDILNAWSAVLKGHTNSNAPLQAGWAASTSVRAAEIMRYTYDGWAPAEVERFGNMLRTAYLPLFSTIGSGTNGNWHLIAYDAAMGIGVFLEDAKVFDTYVAKWRAHTRAYIYITEDGPTPIKPPGLTKNIVDHWYGMKTYMDGLAQETCRDFGHTGYGLAAINTGAETALLQGLDLYGEETKRIVAGMEFHAEYNLGKAPPADLCGGSISRSNSPTWEISYNHFANRKGIAMPFSKRFIETKLRPTGVDHHMAYETLTHANTGSAGIIVSVLPRQVAPGTGMTRLVFDGRGRLQVIRPGLKGVRRFDAKGALLRLGIR